MPDKFDKQAIKDSFSRAATDYDANAHFQKIVRNEAEELAYEYFPDNATLLDLGCGTGLLGAEKENNWKIINLDISYGMCQQSQLKNPYIINASADLLPLKNGSVDGVFSSLMLQWVEKPEAVISEILRVLKPDGVAIITTLTKGTLKELAEAFETVDSSPHISEFVDAGQLLLRIAHAGGVILETHEETHLQELDSVLSLMKSIKQIGAANKNKNRPKGMMTQAKLAKVQNAYVSNIASWQVLTIVIGKK